MGVTAGGHSVSTTFPQGWSRFLRNIYVQFDWKHVAHPLDVWKVMGSNLGPNHVVTKDDVALH